MEPAGPSRAAQSLLRYETSPQPLPTLPTVLQAPGVTKTFWGDALCSLHPKQSGSHVPPLDLAPGPPDRCTLLHDLHNLHDFIHVLPGSDETLQHQHLVVVEHVPVWPTHHLEGRGRVGGGQRMENCQENSMPRAEGLPAGGAQDL